MTEVRNKWDTPTKWFAWLVLTAFTVLSAYMNAEYAVMTKSRVWFHAGIPVVVLVLGVFLELTFLSSAHKTAKRVVVTGLAASFGVVLVASYLAVLHVVEVWNPNAPVWVNQALAAIPDVVMVLAATVILSLRLKRNRAVKDTDTAQPSRWKRIADAAANRAVAKLAVPETPQVEPVVEAHGGSTEVSVERFDPPTDPFMKPVVEPISPAVEPSVKPVDEVVEDSAATFVEVETASVEPSTKPAVEPEPAPTKPDVEAVDPELEPFMEAAQRMVDEEVVTRKTAVELAQVIAALQRRESPNRIKKTLGISPTTTKKISDAWREIGSSDEIETESNSETETGIEIEREPELTVVG